MEFLELFQIKKNLSNMIIINLWLYYLCNAINQDLKLKREFFKYLIFDFIWKNNNLNIVIVKIFILKITLTKISCLKI